MDYNTTLVHEFCNQLSLMWSGSRDMSSFYLWSDKRPGTIEERFLADAREWQNYEAMFRRKYGTQ